MSTNDIIFKAVAAHFGYEQNRALAFWNEQARIEATAATFNPLACTQRLPNSAPFNDAGVQNYATMADGVQAIIWTLDPKSVNPAWTDYYPSIRAALAGQPFDLQTLASQVNTWGTTPFAEEIRSGAWTFPAVIDATTAAPSSEPEAERVSAAVLARFREVAYAFHAFYDPAAAEPTNDNVRALLARLDAAADAARIPDA